MECKFRIYRIIKIVSPDISTYLPNRNFEIIYINKIIYFVRFHSFFDISYGHMHRQTYLATLIKHIDFDFDTGNSFSYACSSIDSDLYTITSTALYVLNVCGHTIGLRYAAPNINLKVANRLECTISHMAIWRADWRWVEIFWFTSSLSRD